MTKIDSPPAQNLRTAEAFLSASPLAHSFAAQLAQQIISGAFAPGERLVETRLAEQFGISRSPVREGLRILANEGLVVLVERRGAMVRPLAATDIAESFACRMALQGLAARQAAERWQGPELATLQHLLAQMEAALDANDVEGYFRADVAYHEYVCQLSRNARLAGLLGVLGREMLRLRHLINTIDGRQHESIVFHRQITAAIERRHADAAERLTRELTWSGCQRLLDHMKQLDSSAQP